MRKDIIPMSIKEFKKLHLVKKANEKLITQARAADVLGITERQFRRMLHKFLLLGECGLVHQLRGRPSHRKLSENLQRTVADIYQKEFDGYRPTFFTEKLASEFDISISKESVRLILAERNLWTVRPRKLKHRTKRPRKPYRGELVQMDGSVHQWFDGSEGYCVLMLYIDDASSTVYARFYPYEGTIPAMDSFRRYIQRYGIPMALYTDLHSTYRNNNKKLSIPEQLAGNTADTQFSRALRQLSVNLVPAFSPQAKGRVERCFQTFQDRLVKELKRLNISSLKDANAFLDAKFLKEHNRLFAVAPALRTDLHRGALPVARLHNILCIQEKRSVAKDFTISFQNRIFQLSQPTIAKQVMIHKFCNGSLAIFHNHQHLKFKEVTHKHLKPDKTNKLPLPFQALVDPITLKEVPSLYAS